MVEAPVLLGIFDGHDVLDVFDHADDALHPLGVGADGAGVGVADGMADMAVVDVGGEAADGLGEEQCLVGGLLEEVERKAEGGAFAYAWK